MLRPPPPRIEPLESEDSSASFGGPFGGLADVLEPDPDALTSVRMGPLSVRSVPLSARHAHAQPHAPVSERTHAPLRIEDFAFADTVFARELDDDSPPPPSGPIYVSDAAGNTQCVTPLAFPLPPANADADLATHMRITLSRVRHAFSGARDEMRELWAGTAEIVEGDGAEQTVFRRALALWSCFQWSRADLTRAAMIGLGVFVVAATIGATTIDFGAASGSSTEVRAKHTLDQHTGKKLVVRSKR